MQLVRAAERFRTDTGWLASRHSFSFGRHYDPRNTHFGLLMASNDDVVAPGSGFSTHPHRDMEILTWVLEGTLVHQDSQGHSGLVTPGLAQRMTAGSGILHSERNDDAAVATRFVQMWVLPDQEGTDPGYAQRDVTADLARGGLVVVASGRGRDAAIPLGQRDAVLHAGRLADGAGCALPEAPWVHLYVARGSVVLEGAGELVEGDAARLTDGGQGLGAGQGGAEVLVWEMHSRAAGW